MSALAVDDDSSVFRKVAERRRLDLVLAYSE
jgi:hypothetical protein